MKLLWNVNFPICQRFISLCRWWQITWYKKLRHFNYLWHVRPLHIPIKFRRLLVCMIPQLYGELYNYPVKISSLRIFTWPIFSDNNKVPIKHENRNYEIVCETYICCDIDFFSFLQQGIDYANMAVSCCRVYTPGAVLKIVNFTTYE